MFGNPYMGYTQIIIEYLTIIDRWCLEFLQTNIYEDVIDKCWLMIIMRMSETQQENLPFLEGLYYVSTIHLLSIVMLGMIYWWVYYIN